jgi:hypothetical protein
MVFEAKERSIINIIVVAAYDNINGLQTEKTSEETTLLMLVPETLQQAQEMRVAARPSGSGHLP